MLCTRPIATRNVMSELPPELTKGSGMPVMGMSPRFMPMLTTLWKKRMVATP